MSGHTDHPASTNAAAAQHGVEIAEHVAGQLAVQVSDAAEAVADAVLPPAPFVARGLRLDWAAKRGLDITVAVSALFLLLPLLLLIAGLVYAGDRKAPIFRHMRLGRHGRRFACLKFR